MLRCSCTFESGVQYLSERETESAFVAKSASEKRWRSSPLQHTDTADRPGLGPNNKSFSLSVFHTVRLSLCRLSLLLSLTCFALPSSCHSLPPSAPPVPSHSLSLPLSLPRLSVTSGGSLGHVEHFITVTLPLLTHRQTLCLHSYFPTPPMLSCTKSAFLD